jgi:hypothetical protein
MKETLTLELGRIHGNTGSRADWNLSGVQSWRNTLPALCRDRISKQELAARLNRFKTFGFLPQNPFSLGPTPVRRNAYDVFRVVHACVSCGSLTSEIKYGKRNFPARRDPENRRINMFGIDLAVSIMDGPELSEHRRKELALARLMAETIDVILYTCESDVDIRSDAAKDMIREVREVYEEPKEL